MKKILSICAVILLTVFSAAACSVDSNNWVEKFDNAEAGGIISSNRDGCVYKLNENFILWYSYGSEENDEIRKIDRLSSQDYYNGSEECYSGKFSECYYDENYIVACLSNSFQCVLIDCNNRENIQTFDSADDINIEYSDFQIINFDPNCNSKLQ